LRRRASSWTCFSTGSAPSALCRSPADDGEVLGLLRRDDIIPHPMTEWTRGITVRTTPARVWPWLVQLGYVRGGWYTPQRADLLANRWVSRRQARVPAPAPAGRCRNTSTLLPGA
jgi:hypothetical protein